MTKSKLAVAYLLMASIFSPMCASAMTSQEAAQMEAVSKAEVTMTPEQKRILLVQLNNEIVLISKQLDHAKSKLKTNKTIKSVGLALNFIGAVAAGYILGGGAKSVGKGLSERVWTAGLLTLFNIEGAVMWTLPAGQVVELNVEQIEAMEKDLTQLKSDYELLVSMTN